VHLFSHVAIVTEFYYCILCMIIYHLFDRALNSSPSICKTDLKVDFLVFQTFKSQKTEILWKSNSYEYGENLDI